MRKDIVHYIGLSAAILGFISLLPLIHHVTINKTTESLSYAWMGTRVVNYMLWFSFGYFSGIYPTMIGAVLNGSAMLYLLFFKYHNERMKRKKGEEDGEDDGEDEEIELSMNQ